MQTVANTQQSQTALSETLLLSRYNVPTGRELYSNMECSQRGAQLEDGRMTAFNMQTFKYRFPTELIEPYSNILGRIVNLLQGNKGILESKGYLICQSDLQNDGKQIWQMLFSEREYLTGLWIKNIELTRAFDKDQYLDIRALKSEVGGIQTGLFIPRHYLNFALTADKKSRMTHAFKQPAFKLEIQLCGPIGWTPYAEWTLKEGQLLPHGRIPDKKGNTYKPADIESDWNAFQTPLTTYDWEIVTGALKRFKETFPEKPYLVA